MFRKTLMALAALAVLAPIASAQTVDELIAKNIAARGGMEKLKATQTLRMTGKMVMSQGMEIPFTMSGKRPKSTRMEFTFQGMTGMQAYDGKTAWAISPMSGKKDPEAVPPDQAKDMDEQADFDGPLVDYKAKGHTIELVGKEPVEGADAYKLKVTMKSGNVRYVYLDAESFLEVKVEAKRMMRGTEIEGESLMGDYRDEGGLMVAHSIDNGAKGSTMRQKLVIEKVEFGVALPDSIFSMPKGAAGADSTKAASPDSSKAAAAKKSEAKKPATAATKK
jgi:outer membrane lipoprotein-sorting protein